MPSEDKNVRYSFTGDTSSLQDAVNKVLNLFDMVDARAKKIGQSESFERMNTQAKRVTSTLKSMASEANKTGQRLKKSFSMANASEVKKQMTQNITATVAQLNNMARSFSDMTSRIVSMETKSSQAFTRMQTRLGSIAAAFRRVSKASDDEGKSADSNIRKTKTLTKLKQELGKASANLSNHFKKVSTSANQAHTGINRLTGSSNKLKSVFSILTGYKIGSFLATGTKEAIHFTEVLNMFTVAMGESNEVADKFVSTIQEMYGLDPTNIMRYTSMFYQLASAVDTPTEAAEKMSMGLTKMTVDIASLFDMPINTVMENLSSGMQGMTRAVRKYGMDLRVTTLQQTALSLGISRQVENMSEADRQGLRYITMMRQASIATGDFGKTIESPANQLRILREQVSQLARAIGNFFIPVLQVVLPYLNGFIMAIRTIINFLGSMIGLTTTAFGGATDAAKQLGNQASSAAGGIGGIGDSAKDAAKKMKQLTAPFDELNILSEDTSDSLSGLGGAGGGIGGEFMDPAIMQAIADMETQFENIEMKANKVRDSILDFLGFKYEGDQLVWVAEDFQKNLVDKFPQWKQTINATFENWDEIVASVKRLGKVLWQTFKNILNPIQKLIVDTFTSIDWDSIFADFITQLPNRLNALSDWILANQDLIQGFTYAVAAVALAFKGWTVLQAYIPLFTKIGAAIKTFVGFLNPVSATLMAVGAALIYAYNKFDTVKEAVASLQEAFATMVGAVGGLMTALWDTTLKPILENMAMQFGGLWETCISPLIESFALLALAVVEAVVSIITVITNLLTLVTTNLGPQFTTAFNLVLDVVTTVIGALTTILDGFMEVLAGLITFITGVFSGDWEKAWEGIKLTFQGVVDGIKGIMRFGVNVIVDLVNGFVSVVYDGLVALIRRINRIASKAAEFLGMDISIPIPDRPPKFPHFAKGGVVTGPTVGLIGEGKYDEAVIPLGDSPQMNEMIQKIVDALHDSPDSAGGGDAVFNITVELDGDVIYKKMKRIEQSKGRDFKMGGFQRG